MLFLEPNDPREKQMMLAVYWRLARTKAGRGEIFVCKACGSFGKSKSHLPSWCCPAFAMVAYENSLVFAFGSTRVHKCRYIRTH